MAQKPKKHRFRGKLYTLTQLSALLGIPYDTLRFRVKRGYSDEKLAGPAFGLPDESGMRSGLWTILGHGEPRITRGLAKVTTFRCQCDCGTIREVDRGSIRKGYSRSCGCVARPKVPVAG